MLLSGVLLVSCSGGAHLDKTELRFWNGFTGPDGRTMLALVKKFNEENPDVRVTLQRMDWATYYNKLFVAGLGKRAPEVFVIHTDTLIRFIDAGFIRPVDDLIAVHDDFPVEDFDVVPWEAASRHGRQYAIPLDVHPVGMFYNRQLLVSAGFVDEEGNPLPPTNREELMEVLRALRNTRSPRDGAPQWGAVLPQHRGLVLSLMKQNGGEFFNADHTACLLGSDANAEALDFIVGLIRRDKLVATLEEYSTLDAWIAFRQGRAATTFEGVYMLGDLRKERELDYAGAPLPVIFKQPATFAGSHNLCISSDADDEKTAAAWRFIQFLSDHSIEWSGAGQVPVRRSYRESELFEQMEVQYSYSKQMPYIFYAPQVPFVFDFFTELDLAIESAVRGRMSAKAALEQASANVDRVIRRQQGLPP